MPPRVPVGGPNSADEVEDDPADFIQAQPGRLRLDGLVGFASLKRGRDVSMGGGGVHVFLSTGGITLAPACWCHSISHKSNGAASGREPDASPS